MEKMREKMRENSFAKNTDYEFQDEGQEQKPFRKRSFPVFDEQLPDTCALPEGGAGGSGGSGQPDPKNPKVDPEPVKCPVQVYL